MAFPQASMPSRQTERLAHLVRPRRVRHEGDPFAVGRDARLVLDEGRGRDRLWRAVAREHPVPDVGSLRARRAEPVNLIDQCATVCRQHALKKIVVVIADQLGRRTAQVGGLPSERRPLSAIGTVEHALAIGALLRPLIGRSLCRQSRARGRCYVVNPDVATRSRGIVTAMRLALGEKRGNA